MKLFLYDYKKSSVVYVGNYPLLSLSGFEITAKTEEHVGYGSKRGW